METSKRRSTIHWIELLYTEPSKRFWTKVLFIRYLMMKGAWNMLSVTRHVRRLNIITTTFILNAQNVAKHIVWMLTFPPSDYQRVISQMPWIYWYREFVNGAMDNFLHRGFFCLSPRINGLSIFLGSKYICSFESHGFNNLCLTFLPL